MTSIKHLEKLTINGERCTAYNADFSSSKTERNPAHCMPEGSIIAGPAYALKENAIWAARQNLTLLDGDLVLFDGQPHEVKLLRGEGYRYPAFYPLHAPEGSR